VLKTDVSGPRSEISTLSAQNSTLKSENSALTFRRQSWLHMEPDWTGQVQTGALVVAQASSRE
jgi:hypothetical protein